MSGLRRQRGPACPGRAPGGARVVGRHDRETILCSHTMDGHSFSRHWKVILSRLTKAKLKVVPRPPREPDSTAFAGEAPAG